MGKIIFFAMNNKWKFIFSESTKCILSDPEVRPGYAPCDNKALASHAHIYMKHLLIGSSRINR